MSVLISNGTVRNKVLRALCRFDSATTEDIQLSCGCSKHQAQQQLRALVEAGYAERLGQTYARYCATETGRHVARSAA